jgi:hypothetical protein
MSLRRSVALNVIRSLAPLNLPADKVIGYLTNMDITYRRIDMLADIRKAYDRVKYETQVTALRDNQVVPRAWMSEEALGEPYNYRVHLKVDYYDTLNDTYVTEHRYMFEDDLKKIGEYKSDFPDYAASKESSPDYEYMGSTVVGVTMNVTEEAPF